MLRNAQPHQMRPPIVRRTYTEVYIERTATYASYTFELVSKDRTDIRQSAANAFMAVDSGTTFVYDAQSLNSRLHSATLADIFRVARVAIRIDFDISAALCHSPFTVSQFFHANVIIICAAAAAVRSWCCVFVLLASVRVFVCLSVCAKTEKKLPIRNYRYCIIID